MNITVIIYLLLSVKSWKSAEDTVSKLSAEIVSSVEKIVEEGSVVEGAAGKVPVHNGYTWIY